MFTLHTGLPRQDEGIILFYFCSIAKDVINVCVGVVSVTVYICFSLMFFFMCFENGGYLCVEDHVLCSNDFFFFPLSFVVLL